MPRSSVVSDTKPTLLVTFGENVTHTALEPSPDAQATVAKVNRLHRLAEKHGNEDGYSGAIADAIALPPQPDDEVTVDRLRERLGL